VRDFVEAAAQRWNRHVVGYDLRQQVHLFRSVRSTYSRFTGRSEVFGGSASPRRIAVFACGLVLIGASVYLLRRMRRAKPEGEVEQAVRDQATLQIIDLYRSLEAALAARGAPRPPGTPPLAHAQALSVLSHPVANEALALTLRYLDARFGGRELSELERRDYARRVRAIRLGREEDSSGAKAA
jgi:hypothetical protein